MISSAQMRQSNGCGSVKNDIQVTLGIWCGPLSQYPLPSARDQPHPLISSAQPINQEEILKKDQTSNKLYGIYCLHLCTHNSGLRVIDLESSPTQRKTKSTKKPDIKKKGDPASISLLKIENRNKISIKTTENIDVVLICLLITCLNFLTSSVSLV